MTNSILMHELTWPEIEAHVKHGNDIVLIPVGATEQHGLHLPLGVDAMVAARVAEDSGRAAGVLVTPPIWSGWSPHHLAYSGTISLRPETLTAVVVDTCRSLIHHGFNKLVIVNGHRIANLPPLQIAAGRVRNTTGAYCAVVDPIFVAETVGRRIFGEGKLGHADELETSHMIHLYPELVHMEKAVKNPPHIRQFHCIDPYVANIDRVYAPPTMATYREATDHAFGTGGDPSESTAEKGREYHEGLVQNMVKLIEEIRLTPVNVFNRYPEF
jgi:creatinine amidohydrolase